MNEKKLHRIFIGCDVSPEFRESAETVINHLKKRLPKTYLLQWAIPTKIHFTLRFIGDTEETNIATISTIIEQTLKNHSSLYLELRNIDFFPKQRPRVLVINLRLTEELAILYANLNRALEEQCGIKKDTRVFLPHITLARFQGTNVEAEHFEKEFRLLPEKILIDKVYLFESNQQNREEKYKKLKEVLLF